MKSEHEEQVLFFQKVWVLSCQHPELKEPLRWIHAIPNGGARDIRTAAKLKAEGVKSGIWDIFWPYRSKGYSGLYIEMKRSDHRPKREGSKGGLSDEQIAFRDFAQSQGFLCKVVYNADEACKILLNYVVIQHWH